MQRRTQAKSDAVRMCARCGYARPRKNPKHRCPIDLSQGDLSKDFVAIEGSHAPSPATELRGTRQCPSSGVTTAHSWPIMRWTAPVKCLRCRSGYPATGCYEDGGAWRRSRSRQRRRQPICRYRLQCELELIAAGRLRVAAKLSKPLARRPLQAGAAGLAD